MSSMNFPRAAWVVLLAGTLPAGTSCAQSPSPYQHVLSSGPFGLPDNAKSVDWMVLNDSPDSQFVRVTVYQVKIGTAKTPVPPGPISKTLLPYFATHNANSVGVGKPFTAGGVYEVVVELNDKRVLPTVDVWSNFAATVIAGTHLSPQDFSDIK